MIERVFDLTVTDRDYRLRILEVLNGIAKLTQKERLVFLSFCELYDSSLFPDILSAESRRALASKINMNPSSINNIISQLKKKKAIAFDGTNYYLNPLLVPTKDLQQIRVVIHHR